MQIEQQEQSKQEIDPMAVCDFCDCWALDDIIDGKSSELIPIEIDDEGYKVCPTCKETKPWLE